MVQTNRFAVEHRNAGWRGWNRVIDYVSEMDRETIFLVATNHAIERLHAHGIAADALLMVSKLDLVRIKVVVREALGSECYWKSFGGDVRKVTRKLMRNTVIGLAVPVVASTIMFGWAIGLFAFVALGSIGFVLLSLWKAHTAFVSGTLDKSRKTTVAQVQSFESLTTFLGSSILLPPLSNFRISADNAWIVIQQIVYRRAGVIVELGCGVSTLLIAAILRKCGFGHLYSVENDEKFAQETEELLNHHHLGPLVTIIRAPLVEQLINGRTHLWYRRSALDPIPSGIEVVLVDGPPRRIHKLARYPAIPVLWEKLSTESKIFLDDASRPDERTIVRRWIDENPTLCEEFVPTADGLAILSLCAPKKTSIITD